MGVGLCCTICTFREVKEDHVIPPPGVSGLLPPALAAEHFSIKTDGQTAPLDSRHVLSEESDNRINKFRNVEEEVLESAAVSPWHDPVVQ